jgi:hypothetical protein
MLVSGARVAGHPSRDVRYFFGGLRSGIFRTGSPNRLTLRVTSRPLSPTRSGSLKARSHCHVPCGAGAVDENHIGGH